MKLGMIISLAGCLLAAVPTAGGATIPLKDVFGIDSGWDADIPDDIHTGIVVDKVTSSYVRIEIFKDLDQPAREGDFPPHLIQFHPRTGSAVSTIRITDETIINDTGMPWTDYHWSIVGLGASFNTTLTDASGFSVSPFQTKTWGPLVSTGHSRQLGVSNGVIAPGSVYRPGLAKGELVIDILPSLDLPSRTFTLMQYPTPEPATLVTVVLGGLIALARRRRRCA